MDYRSGFLFNRRGKQIFNARAGAPDSPEVWVICPPFFEEGVVTHDILRNFARKTAEHGALAVRFDYEGTGDSEGTLEQVGLDEWVNDALDIVRSIQTEFPRRTTCFLGIRGGAWVASRAALQTPGARVTAWHPIESGEEYFRELLRFNLTAQLSAWHNVRSSREDLIKKMEAGGTVNVLGWDLTAKSVRAMRSSVFSEMAALLGSRMRVLLSGGRPFWHDPRLVDFDQEELVNSTLHDKGDQAR